ncbi:MAG: hypothetical protein HOP16_01235 [Acidobacteria bacterium]|nr:hypothetical protein [Acidobacteriota bacterium]
MTALLATLTAAGVAQQRRDAFVEGRDHPAIAYSTGPVTDAATVLNRRLAEGSLHLGFDPISGYLRSVLDALNVPIESQALVFSQTSSQAPLISMHNPRAVYFNDTAAVGWVRGGSQLEVMAQDGRQGPVFYVLDQRPVSVPQLTRTDQCLSCHLSWDTLGVPGLLLQSVLPLAAEKNAYAMGFVTDHRSPLSERWGGWYVTGQHGATQHLGNVPVMPADRGTGIVNPRDPLESLAGRFDLSGYPSPYSDVVPQMVLAHQSRMTNLLTRLGWEARVAIVGPGAGGDTRVQEAVNDLVDYMLFVDEEALAAPVHGTSGFGERFTAQGPRDTRGRSLRDLDLQRRLLRYPCSYMIYSDAFAALPGPIRDRVYARMWRILQGQERGPRYARLSGADRQAVIQILRETKQDLPPFFL